MPSISRPPPLPGFGLSLSYKSSDDLFPSALDPKLSEYYEPDNGDHRARLPAFTLRELRMLEFMNTVTDKPNWETKVLSGEIFKSDTAIPSELKLLLKSAFVPLESVPEDERDWHPGSNEQVLDLVHPSLFPLVYDLSRILPDSTTDLGDCIERCGAGELAVLTSSPSGFTDAAYSENFQWLPCDVDISGDTPKIISYINNLHPQKHNSLYEIIEKVLAKVIPFWNATLSSLLDHIPQCIGYYGVHYHEDAWEKYREDHEPEQEEGEDDTDFEERQDDWESNHKKKFYVQPDVEEDFQPPEDDIIVKLANILLTPEKPEYAGGTWHIEGQLNEHICATAIYYYDVENISSSKLHFRACIDPASVDADCERNDNYWVEEIYGLENYAPAIQELGGVEAREGRLITFPNILQHQVQPFGLADPTKPGHRKILALFLVEPNIKIISTANVPCQRQDWREELILDSNVLLKLPVELRDIVVKDRGDFPISLHEAKEIREELMEERREYVLGYQRGTSKTQISLCEH
ncbi:hypothetical protein NP233_g5305 [Leucocoprinus birnbaumii]|uniref:DUF4246 domain-containing protein n=1 Tax=Leucocoprinus birnbaumii TaxID=56174 RepID=A0AAD5YWJ8_9AGAR|nr:hypothetical protein NP233_g5305 [Leucocoprinus birnbaumii]